jgi:hypothetical protein
MDSMHYNMIAGREAGAASGRGAGRQVRKPGGDSDKTKPMPPNDGEEALGVSGVLTKQSQTWVV